MRDGPWFGFWHPLAGFRGSDALIRPLWALVLIYRYLPLPHHPQTHSVYIIKKLEGRYLKSKTNKGFLKVSWTVNSSHFHAFFRTLPFTSPGASRVWYHNTLHGLFEKYRFPEGSESSQSSNISSCGTAFTFLVFPLTSSEMSVNYWMFSSPVWWAQAFLSLFIYFSWLFILGLRYCQCVLHLLSRKCPQIWVIVVVGQLFI